MDPGMRQPRVSNQRGNELVKGAGLLPAGFIDPFGLALLAPALTDLPVLHLLPTPLECVWLVVTSCSLPTC